MLYYIFVFNMPKVNQVYSDEVLLFFKFYYFSISLILITQDDGVSDHHAERVLDCAFQAMVLLYGQHDLVNIKNLERFKREIKVTGKLFFLFFLPFLSFFSVTHVTSWLSFFPHVPHMFQHFCNIFRSSY